VTQAADVQYTSPLQVWISDAMDESHMGLCGLSSLGHLREKYIELRPSDLLIRLHIRVTDVYVVGVSGRANYGMIA
jgi:hypothetical protein